MTDLSNQSYQHLSRPHLNTQDNRFRLALVSSHRSCTAVHRIAAGGLRCCFIFLNTNRSLSTSFLYCCDMGYEANFSKKMVKAISLHTYPPHCEITSSSPSNSKIMLSGTGLGLSGSGRIVI